MSIYLQEYKGDYIIMIRRTISMDEDLWEKVKIKASYSGLSISSVIRALLRLWVDEKVKI